MYINVYKSDVICRNERGQFVGRCTALSGDDVVRATYSECLGSQCFRQILVSWSSSPRSLLVHVAVLATCSGACHHIHPSSCLLPPSYPSLFSRIPHVITPPPGGHLSRGSCSGRPCSRLPVLLYGCNIRRVLWGRSRKGRERVVLN